MAQIIIKLLLDKDFNPQRGVLFVFSRVYILITGSITVEKMQNLLLRYHRGFYEQVIGMGPGRFVRYLEARPEVFRLGEHSYSFLEGQRRIRRHSHNLGRRLLQTLAFVNSA